MLNIKKNHYNMSTPNVMDSDEYYVTAQQMFEYCGTEGTGILPVNTLMDKFEPFIRTDKSEYSYLQSLLDPEKVNPEVNVTDLASALEKYSHRQKTKQDFDESFNLKSGSTPQDSDSGISSEYGFHLEELQSELREKAHLASRLRHQLDFTDRQHEEAMSALTAERDSLRAHLQLMRDENMALVCVRRDYEDMCERLSAGETALKHASRELDTTRRRCRALEDLCEQVENDKLTLQGLLTKSKEECHRMNDMYASRQAALLEENETLKSDFADLSTRFQDQEEFMQQLIKEKVLLEMELKDMLNKSNHMDSLGMDRSIDVSYTDAQLLTALDSLNSESRFHQDNLSREEIFMNEFKEDQGRLTNISLFDELRQSLDSFRKNDTMSDCEQCNTGKESIAVGVQTDACIAEIGNNNNSDLPCGDCYSAKNVIDFHECEDCKKKLLHIGDLECKVSRAQSTLLDLEEEIVCYEDNLITLEKLVESSDAKNHLLQKVVDSFHIKLNLLDVAYITQSDNINRLVKRETRCAQSQMDSSPTCCTECQTDSLAATKMCCAITQTSPIAMCEIGSQIGCLVISETGTQTCCVKMCCSESQTNNDVVKTHSVKCQTESICSGIQNGDLQSSVSTVHEVSHAGCQCDSLAREVHCIECQTSSEQATVATQFDQACVECERNTLTTSRSASRTLRSYFWDGLRGMFQLFALLCFGMALLYLYNVSHYSYAARRCVRNSAVVPWEWLGVGDLLNFIFRIEYVGEVPM